MAKTVLVSPLHDPHSRLINELHDNLPKLKEIFQNGIYLSVTEKTSPEIKDALSGNQINFEIQPLINGISVGDNMRRAINLGILANPSSILLLDFDRALHWAKRFPEELSQINEKLSGFSGFTSFIRTRRAFESHPLIQRTTETTINAIASEVAKTEVDIMSGAFGMDTMLAREIVDKANRNDYGIYAQLLQIAIQQNAKINVLEVEGLEWETPDQFKQEIDENGYSAWLNAFESLEEWEKRVKLIEDSSQVLINE